MPSGRPASRAVAARAFEVEALGYLNGLYAAAVRLTGRRADAEDVVQETYLKAFRSADRFEPGTNLKAWLFTILHNTWRNRRRDAGREPLDVDSDTVERAAAEMPDAVTPEALLLQNTLDADLQAALNVVPAVFREAMWLRDVDGFTYAEIAAMLQVPIGTVMSRIARGRRLLYQALTARTDRFGPLEAVR